MNKLILILLIVLTSCSTKSTESKQEELTNVKASIYYYDSIYQDTLIIEATLVQEKSTRTTGGVTYPVTSLTNNYISIIYSSDKIDYVDHRNKVSVSYRSSPNTFITTEGTLTSDIIIGSNNSSSLSIFIK
jgi:hypothetical protein